LSRQATALGIIDIANVNIDRAVRRVSIARGYDPRDFTLMAFGGAGPLHACEVAARLEIPRVLIPQFPGVLCALGLLVADVQRDYSQSILGNIHIADLQQQLREMIATAQNDLLDEGISFDQMSFVGLLDMRYRGQSYELTVPFSDDLEAGFHAAHERAYGHAMPDRLVEVVNLRLQAIGRVEKPVFEPEPLVENDGSSGLIGGRGVALYERDKLLPGARFPSPALIFQLDSTSYIPSGWTVFVDGYRNLILEKHTL
jgi:N-methylhydantoinase A/oxoprolinase/acetone carboxylase beta subunit